MNGLSFAMGGRFLGMAYALMNRKLKNWAKI